MNTILWLTRSLLCFFFFCFLYVCMCLTTKLVSSELIESDKVVLNISWNRARPVMSVRWCPWGGATVPDACPGHRGGASAASRPSPGCGDGHTTAVVWLSLCYGYNVPLVSSSPFLLLWCSSCMALAMIWVGRGAVLVAARCCNQASTPTGALWW